MQKFIVVATVVCLIGRVCKTMNLSQHLLKGLHEAILQRPLLPLFMLVVCQLRRVP